MKLLLLTTLLCLAHAGKKTVRKRVPTTPRRRRPPAPTANYTLSAKVSSAVDCRRIWHLRGRRSRVVNLAIARTGSESVTRTMAAAGAAAHHDHACSLRDASRAGYDRVVISLRDPAARLVSGFQRRVAGGAKKRANRDLADIFGDDVDGYVEALRDVTHAKHAAALRVSLAPNAQHWLMPIEEYYLRGFEPRANGSLAVAFVCTEALDAGVRAVAARWDLRAPPATEATTHHASPNKSHGGMLAPANAAYVRALYARDAALHAAHCKNDVSFVRYGPVTGPKKGPRSEWGPSERRAYGRLTVDHARRFVAAATVARPAAGARLAPEKRREGVLFAAAGSASFVAAEVAPAVAHLQRVGVPNATDRSGVAYALYLETGLHAAAAEIRPFFDLIFDINEPIRKMAAGALRLDGMYKAYKLMSVAASPFDRTLYLDFDSRVCAPNSMRRLLDAGIDGDVMATSKYLGTSDPWAVQHSSNVVVVNGPRGRALFSVALLAYRLIGGPRGTQPPDQPALMVALRAVASADGILREAWPLNFTEASPDLVCRAKISSSTTCSPTSPCAVVHKPAKHDASRKIFVVGFKKTGTTTMERILATLKMTPALPGKIRVAASRALVRNGDPEPALAAAASPARAFEDSPWCSAAAIPQFGGARLYEELAKRHENARFILTVRESQSWWASVERWVAVKASKKEKLIRTYTTLLGVTRFDNETFIEAYEEHNRRVQDFFSDQPDRLLVVDLREATWSTFCVFLEYWSGCPSGDLPRENTYQAPARSNSRSRRSGGKSSPYVGPLGM